MVAGVHFVLAIIFIASLLALLGPHIPSGLDRPNMALLVAAILASMIFSFAIGLGILRWQNWSRPLALAWHSLNVIAVFVSILRQQVTFESLIRMAISAFVIWWLCVPAVRSCFQSGGSEEK
ncbi:MAG TPA: hypothetical protein VKP58_16270 [Candidatus Acidoferrum sp.]|nr:hypothetical protein [Candidatus Acidoferrum sp.]